MSEKHDTKCADVKLCAWSCFSSSDSVLYFKALGVFNAYSVAAHVAQCASSYRLSLMVSRAHIKVCIFVIFAKVLEVVIR